MTEKEYVRMSEVFARATSLQREIDHLEESLSKTNHLINVISANDLTGDILFLEINAFSIREYFDSNEIKMILDGVQQGLQSQLAKRKEKFKEL